jgi:chemotaxis protein MotB
MSRPQVTIRTGGQQGGEEKSWWLEITLGVLLALTIGGFIVFLFVSHIPAKNEIKSLQAKLDEMTLKHNNSQARIRDMEKTMKAKENEINQLKSTYDDLMAKLQKEIASGDAEITNIGGRLSVNLRDRLLFDSGQTEVKVEGLEVLQRVAQSLMALVDKQILIEGHTDDQKIGPTLAKLYPTNWELSATRALNVVKYLESLGIDAERMAGVGYGQFRPKADNATEEGRAKNRRIEIVLLPLELFLPSVEVKK